MIGMKNVRIIAIAALKIWTNYRDTGTDIEIQAVVLAQDRQVVLDRLGWDQEEIEIQVVVLDQEETEVQAVVLDQDRLYQEEIEVQVVGLDQEEIEKKLKTMEVEQVLEDDDVHQDQRIQFF